LDVLDSKIVRPIN